MDSKAVKVSSLRLAADIGGTFTDIAAFDAQTGKLLFGKALSTPKSLVVGISNGIAKTGANYSDAAIFLHGTTIAINTMLERTGAKTAMITTEGFRDVYEIGRINRPDSYNLFFQKHEPLVRRSRRFEVRERLHAEGDVRTPLDEKGVQKLARRLRRDGMEAVGILLLHSYRNPDHEIRVKEIVQEEMPSAFVSASHELSQEYREFERGSTVVANAYIGPKIRQYLSEIETRLAEGDFNGSFLIVQSTGGLYEAKQAKSECVRMLESGPAAGVIGTRALCDAMSVFNAISFDMGGTTAKAGVIYNGQPLITGNALIGGYERALPIQISMMDIFEVGTGGGSIAQATAGGSLHVGPESAGAQPGPACYGKGGDQPTVTDANLFLGRLSPENFLGGEMGLDVNAAERALRTKIARPLAMDTTAAAEGILRIAATAMSYAVKGVTTERGMDAADFTMVAFGGAGPLHASDVAREIGMHTVVIPQSPGYFSAFGMLFSDLRYDYVRTWPVRLAEAEFGDIEKLYREMEKTGRAAIKKTSIKPDKIAVSRAADMRYVGQEHSVTVDLPVGLFKANDRDAIKREFDRVHEFRYGTCAPDEQAELVSLRLTVSGVLRKPRLEPVRRGSARPRRAAKTGIRPVGYAGSGFVETPIFAREHLLAGNKISGPAVIEEYASTTILNPGDKMLVDELGNLVIAIGRTR